jgi:hypothetical protein
VQVLLQVLVQVLVQALVQALVQVQVQMKVQVQVLLRMDLVCFKLGDGVSGADSITNFLEPSSDVALRHCGR